MLITHNFTTALKRTIFLDVFFFLCLFCVNVLHLRVHRFQDASRPANTLAISTDEPTINVISTDKVKGHGGTAMVFTVKKLTTVS